MATGVSGKRLSNVVRIAKPTPWRRRWSARRPLQKKVYPSPTSVSEPSSASLVSQSAAMSILYLLSSAATSAVRRGGLSESSTAASNKVLTFQVARRYLCCKVFGLVFRPQWWDVLTSAVARQGDEWNRQCLDHLFYVPPHSRWAVWSLKRAAQSHWKLPEVSAVPVPGLQRPSFQCRLCAGRGLKTSSYIQNLSPSLDKPIATGLESGSAITCARKFIVGRGRTVLSPLTLTAGSRFRWQGKAKDDRY